MRFFAPPPVKAISRYFANVHLAREIDPQAFEPLMVPSYTGEQLARQQDALAEARRRNGEGEEE